MSGREIRGLLVISIGGEHRRPDGNAPRSLCPLDVERGIRWLRLRPAIEIANRLLTELLSTGVDSSEACGHREENAQITRGSVDSRRQPGRLPTD